ncbi:MAG: hypothetical protein ACPL1K_01515, partial [Candidatus Kryptoniota bacterium]
ENWDANDSIRIYHGDNSVWPHTDIVNHHIEMPERFNPYSSGDFYSFPNEPNYYRTLVHEIGHLKFLLWDEYIIYIIFPFLSVEIPAIERVHSIMANQYSYSEFSTLVDYFEILAEGIYPLNNAQYVYGGGSCWQRIFKDYNYFFGYLAITGVLPRGVQFDLDNNNIIDIFYYMGYDGDSFGNLYPIGNFAMISIYC